LFLSVLVAGCGDAKSIKLAPVSGVVTFDGRPLTAKSTAIVFKPDRTRGNETTLEPAGTVDDQGNYTVLSAGKKGAPVGWYKVVVTAYERRPEHPKTSGRSKGPATAALLPAQYGQEATTPLAVEVSEKPAPGAYDLKLSK
jgi:hypothetical protein